MSTCSANGYFADALPETGIAVYYRRMLKRTLFPILSFLLVVGTVLCAVRPSGAGAWFCEGKQCGVTAWVCCCEESSVQAGNCDAPPSESRGESLADCDTRCGCTMVITEDADCDHTLPSVADSFQPAVVIATLPATLSSCVPPALDKSVSRHAGSRGPPLQRPAHTSASLRAPPAA